MEETEAEEEAEVVRAYATNATKKATLPENVPMKETTMTEADRTSDREEMTAALTEERAMMTMMPTMTINGEATMMMLLNRPVVGATVAKTKR